MLFNTTEELIQDLYKETLLETAPFMETILKEEFMLLDEFLESPRSQSVLAVLDYAKRTSI